MKKAFLFDLNGTMINDMEYHVTAWHRILNELGAGISLERMQQECYGKNHELLERIFPGRFSNEEKTKMSYDKETAYQEKFRPFLKLLPGLPEFFEKASKAGIKMAIGSASIMYNIDYVLDGLNIRHYFDAIISADDVLTSKPDPETYIKCADILQVPYKNCIVFEDATKGVEAAQRAQMKAVVIKGFHEPKEFEYLDNIINMVDDFTDPALNTLF